MTGGSPTSGADPPQIRCSIRSVIRTFWRARARLHAPDADDASSGRRCLAARYGEKRGGVSCPPAFLHTLRRRCCRCHPAVRRCRRRHGSVVGACTAAVGGALPQWGAHCCSGGRTAAVGGALPQWGAHCRSGGRTAAVGGALPQWGALRAVAVALPAPRAAPPPSPPRAPSERSLHAGGRGSGRARFHRSWTACAAPGGASRGRPDPAIGMARFRRSWGVWRRPGGACGGRRRRCPATDQRRSA